MPYDGFQSTEFTRSVMKAELLDADTEFDLARRWRDDRDEAALHRLITAYMRLAVSVAAKFKRYGAPMSDLVQEAGLGLMKAAEKFDPDRGVRFSTYAVWWIRASVQDHVMRNWSLVRTGSTSSQKSLFFNLRRVQAQLERELSARGVAVNSHELRELIAGELGVSLADVEMMQGRLSGNDFSLDATQSSDEEGRSWVDVLEDESPIGSGLVEVAHDSALLRECLIEAMQKLTGRERLIVRERRLREDGRTLESIGRELGVSKERVRQLEVSALGKMRKFLEECGSDVHSFLS